MSRKLRCAGRRCINGRTAGVQCWPRRDRGQWRLRNTARWPCNYGNLTIRQRGWQQSAILGSQLHFCKGESREAAVGAPAQVDTEKETITRFSRACPNLRHREMNRPGAIVSLIRCCRTRLKKRSGCHRHVLLSRAGACSLEQHGVELHDDVDRIQASGAYDLHGHIGQRTGSHLGGNRRHAHLGCRLGI